MIGRITSTLSLIRLQKYSLFQKYRARSATFGWALVKFVIYRDVPYLEMRACNGLGQLVEERLLNLGELIRIHNLKDILYLIEVHDFLSTIDLRPISEQSENDLVLYHKSNSCYHDAGILTSSVSAASFSRNCTIQYANCG